MTKISLQGLVSAVGRAASRVVGMRPDQSTPACSTADMPAQAHPATSPIPDRLGMAWWDPGLGHVGSPEDITALGNQQTGGPDLQRVGEATITLDRADGRTWLCLPQGTASGALAAGALSGSLGHQANAPFTVALAFRQHPDPKVTSLWSMSNAQKTGPARINIDLSDGRLKLFSLDAAGQHGNRITRIRVPADGTPQTLVISARSGGHVSIWHNGMLMESDEPWVRPKMTDLQTFCFGGLVHGASILRCFHGGFGAFLWRPGDMTNEDCAALSGFLHEGFN